jgi:hypothetical protein
MSPGIDGCDAFVLYRSCIFCTFLHIPHPVVTLTKFWIHEMDDMYAGMYYECVCVCVCVNLMMVYRHFHLDS